MEGRGQSLAFAHQDWIVAFRRDYIHSVADALDLRRADEDHLDRIVEELSFADRTVHLSAVSVAADGDVERAESGLLRVLDFIRQQDGSSACPESGFHANEFF